MPGKVSRRLAMIDDMRRPEAGSIRDHPVTSPRSVDAAVEALTDASRRVVLASFAAAPGEVDRPGLYAWFVDDAGTEGLSRGLRIRLQPGLVYAGQAGAGTSTATLRTRISGNHRSGTIRGSTFRRTLAALLAGDLGLRRDGPDRLADDGEVRLSAWMREHLQIAVAPWDDRSSLGHLEDLVLDRLDPPLNLQGMRPSPVRLALSRLRAARDVGPTPAPCHAPGASTPQVCEASITQIPSRTSGPAPDIATYLGTLVGRTIPTMTGRPNRIVRLSGDHVWVATERSPQGKPVAIAEIQEAADLLFAHCDLIIDVATVGHRSAFVGAVLGSLPGVVVMTRPRRVVLADRPTRR